MQHLTEGTLMACLDGEHSPAEQAQLDAHLADCPSCRENLAQMRATRSAIGQAFSLTAPGPLQQSDSRRALYHFTTRQSTIHFTGRKMMLEKLQTNRKLQRVLIGLAALALIAGLFSLAPVRALASEFLGLFRVERFAVVDVDPERLDEIAAAIDENMYFGEQEVLQTGEMTEVGTYEAAAAQVDFTLRIPTGYGDPAAVSVTTEQKFRYTPQLEDMREVFTALSLDPDLLPAEADGQPFDITVPAMVAAYYEQTGDQAGFGLMQLPAPMVDVPEGVDMQQLGEAMLQLLGMSPAEAARLSETIDWTTTLIKPVPTNLGSVQEIKVDGVAGVLFESYGYADEQGDWHDEKMLMWQKDGILYILTLQDGSDRLLLDIAGSLE